MKEILSTMQANHYMNLVIVIVSVIAVLIAWNIQRDKNNQIDLKDLVCTDGRINEAKFMRFCTFVVSTWGFVYLIVDQRFSEWYFAGYMAAWTGNALVNKWLTIKEQTTASPVNPPPPLVKPQY
jgi:hypothetical protein